MFLLLKDSTFSQAYITELLQMIIQINKLKKYAEKHHDKEYAVNLCLREIERQKKNKYRVVYYYSIKQLLYIIFKN
jgi:phage-related protein